MIHVTRSNRAEVVLFGRGSVHDAAVDHRRQPDHDHQFDPRARSPSASSASATPTRSGWSPPVDDVIRAIVELGGTYPDVVQALQEAKAAGALPSRFEVEADPEGGRTMSAVAQKTAKEKSSASDNGQAAGNVDRTVNAKGSGNAIGKRDLRNRQEAVVRPRRIRPEIGVGCGVLC